MNKVKIILVSILLTPIIAGAFGIIHDQITYSISEEYFTKFKFIQFQITDQLINSHRLAVTFIGFLATWWVGAFIGIVLSICFLTYKLNQPLYTFYFKSIVFIFSTTIICSVLGYLYSHTLSVKDLNWYLPPNLIDLKHFLIVGSIHNASYLGGMLGLTVGVIYLLRNSGRQKKFDFPKMKSVKN